MSGTARLHQSESAYGTSPAALAAAHRALERVSTYPDPQRTELTRALARHHGVAPDQVAVANGSDELVLLSAIAIGAPEHPGVSTAATFPGYRICLEGTGRGCREVALRGTRTHVSRLCAALPHAGVAFVCNPHNPTGRALAVNELQDLVCAAVTADVPLVVDEAYLEFAPVGTPQVLDHLAPDRKLLSLRTFSKAFGLAALRIGYAVGQPELIACLRAAQSMVPFSVNEVAQAAAVAVLGDPGFLDGVRERNAEQRDWFRGEVARRGGSSLPSVTNFVAVPVGASAAVAHALAADHRILVRDAGVFGLAGYLRVSMGPRADLLRLLDVLQDLHAFADVDSVPAD